MKSAPKRRLRKLKAEPALRSLCVHDTAFCGWPWTHRQLLAMPFCGVVSPSSTPPMVGIFLVVRMNTGARKKPAQHAGLITRSAALFK